MSNSDLPLESDAVAALPATRLDPPRIVNLPSSFDMGEFPSEAADVQGESALDAFAAEAPAPIPVEAPIEVSDAPSPPPARLDEPRPAPPAAAGASVLEFPTAGSEPAALTQLPARGAPDTITLVDILEQRGGMNWRESVALVHKLCDQLKQQAANGPVVLDPRNIQITATGDVHLLPGQTGGDPLVIQVGRLLRTMLMGRPAPSELRLLLSQATFELPIFESLDDVDRALAQVERLDKSKDAPPEIITTPTPKHVPLKTVQSVPLRRDAGADGPPQGSRAIRPTAAPRRSGHSPLPPIGAFLSLYSTRIVAGLITVAVLGALFLTEQPFLLPVVNTPTTPVNVTPGTARAEPPSIPAPRATSAPADVATLKVESVAPPGGQRPVLPLETRSAGRAPRTPNLDHTNGGASRAAPAAVSTAGVVAPRESERRAAELVSQGQAAQAAMVFDSLLLANPLYEPKPTDVTPESLAAFRASQKVLLPVLAQRGYDRARSALAAGDADRALSTARETAAILERTTGEPAFRQQVQQLIEEASALRTAADEIVYTAKDTGVVPPRPLSRQFPAATPNGVPPHRVGTLEMVIGKDGTVEFVKLHTPLNRYHERMIVSAAKAWQYRPATKGGRPVKYRLTVTINLPENGTD